MTQPQETSWLAAVHVDHGKYFLVEQRYIDAPTREEAASRIMAKLRPNESLNGISLIPAKEYFALNGASAKKQK